MHHEEPVLTEGPRYNVEPDKQRIRWYRCPVPREQLRKLNQRSNLLGFAQTLGFLAVLAAGAGAAIYSAFHWPWYVTALLVFLNGHTWHFIINGFHELVHLSVFRTRWLNTFFLRIFSFLGWHNHHWFWASHTEHHKYTLHPPDDLEVILPARYSLRWVLKVGIVNVRYPWQVVRDQARLAMGRINLDDPWTASLFPETDPQRRRQLINWARILLIGHGLIAAAAIVAGWWVGGWWIVLLVVTFPMTFGGWLHFLCNSTQHAGLSERTPDYRLCCRTIYLNPLLQFLYWHMNYHTEHHMYAAVPCYNLGRLHRLIRHDMPHCPRGLIETWTQIVRIIKRQNREPDWCYVPELPDTAHPAAAEPMRP